MKSYFILLFVIGFYGKIGAFEQLVTPLHGHVIPPFNAHASGGSSFFLAPPTPTPFNTVTYARGFAPTIVRRINPESLAPILKQVDEKRPDGSYNYEYQTGNRINVQQSSIRNGDENVVRGSYSYVGPDDVTYTVNYIADRYGYRAFGAHLPNQPDVVINSNTRLSQQRAKSTGSQVERIVYTPNPDSFVAVTPNPTYFVPRNTGKSFLTLKNSFSNPTGFLLTPTPRNPILVPASSHFVPQRAYTHTIVKPIEITYNGGLYSGSTVSPLAFTPGGHTLGETYSISTTPTPF